MTEVFVPYKDKVKIGQGIMLAPGFPPLTIEGLNTAVALGDVLAKSGFYGNVKTAAQAVVKILKGQALGLDPIYAMSHVYVIDLGANRAPAISLSAECMAALIRKSGRYSYKIGRWDETQCSIMFYAIDSTRTARIVHESRYTMDDAKLAGLDQRETYKKYPKAMLFAGAMRHGFKVATPDLACGCLGSGGQEADIIEAEVYADSVETDDLAAERIGEDSEREPQESPEAKAGRLAESWRVLFGDEPKSQAPSGGVSPVSAQPKQAEVEYPPPAEAKPAEAKAANGETAKKLFYERINTLLAAKAINPAGVREIVTRFDGNWSGALDWANGLPMPMKRVDEVSE